MDNHNEKQSHSMLWMMLPCLLVPIAILLVGKSASGSWLSWIIIGVCVAPCIVMMFRGHGSHGKQSESIVSEEVGKSNADTKSGHSCCH